MNLINYATNNNSDNNESKNLIRATASMFKFKPQRYFLHPTKYKSWQEEMSVFGNPMI